ncbi:MAG: cytochrome c peroxidase [Candidatus Paceibacteria bacterium]|jgi:cytochrome c peroxidase
MLKTKRTLNPALPVALAIGLGAQFSPAFSQFSAPPPPPPPAGNPITVNKALLGKVLFWDEQLSATGTAACATCHIPTAGGSDPRSVPNANSTHPGADGFFGTADDIVGSIGVPASLPNGRYSLNGDFGLDPQVTSRKAQTVINAVYSPLLQFWDGRAEEVFLDPISGAVVLAAGAALESQAAGPVDSGVEMGHLGTNWPGVVNRITSANPMDLAVSMPADMATFVAGRTYPQLFTLAFGTNQVTAARICMAIATYERTLVGATAPFDTFIGNSPPGAPPQNPGALTQQERAGFQIFNGPGRCNVCHNGPIFSDNDFHYTGVRPVNEDLGRFVVDGLPGHRGSMKTPSLRNVELRGPFFHNGRFGTLEEVVEFYNRGGDFDAPNKAPAVQPLGLSPGQRAALVAFLKRPLTDVRVRDGLPPFDSPTLFTQSMNAADSYGIGTPGTDGFVPEMYAIEPPKIGNDNMTVGITGALAGRMAILGMDPVPDFAGTPITGTMFHIGLSSSLSIKRIPVLNGSGAGNGWGSVIVNVPNDTALIGTTLYAQWFVLDNGSGARFAASDAIAISWY